MSQNEEICPLCGRPLGDKKNWNLHHLKPKSLKGKEVVKLHYICHSKIHSLFTERELLNYYHTIEKLRSHDGIKKFIKWVSKKPPEYRDSNKRANRRK